MMTDTTLPLHDDTAQPPVSETPPPAPPTPPAPPEPRRGPGGWAVLLAAILVSALVSAGITSAMIRRDEQTPAVAPDLAAQDSANDEVAPQDGAPGNDTDVGA